MMAVPMEFYSIRKFWTLWNFTWFWPASGWAWLTHNTQGCEISIRMTPYNRCDEFGVVIFQLKSIFCIQTHDMHQMPVHLLWRRILLLHHHIHNVIKSIQEEIQGFYFSHISQIDCYQHFRHCWWQIESSCKSEHCFCCKLRAPWLQHQTFCIDYWKQLWGWRGQKLELQSWGGF